MNAAETALSKVPSVRFIPPEGMRYILADLSWVMYRGHYAYQSLTAAVDGQVLRTGCIKYPCALAASVRRKGTDILIFCVDNYPKARMEFNPEYKDQRDPDRPEIHKYVPDVAHLMSNLEQVVFAQAPEHEADDVIAGLANSLSERAQVVIFSNDKDFFQLQGDRVQIAHKFKKGVFDILPYARTFEQCGVLPEQLPVFRTLTGDSSDGIKGIYRISKDLAAAISARITSFEQYPQVYGELMREYGNSKSRVKSLVEIRRRLRELKDNHTKMMTLRNLTYFDLPIEWKRGTVAMGLQLADRYELGVRTRIDLRLV